MTCQSSVSITRNILLTVLALIPMPVECAQPDKIGAMGTAAASTPGYWVMDQNGNYSWDGTSTDGVYLWSTGQPGEVPVVGDWNGDGRTKMGVYFNGTWLLDYNGNGVWDGPAVDKLVYWGDSGSVPVVGDWDGTGKTKIGTYNSSNGIFLIDYNGNFAWDGTSVDRSVYWSDGNAGNIPVIGDWNGTGSYKIGIFYQGLWVLDYDGNYDWNPSVDKVFAWTNGNGADVPVVGDWNGTHTTKIGVYDNGYWVVDYNGSFSWDPLADKTAFYGGSGFVPVVGDWGGDGKTKIAAYSIVSPSEGAWVIDVNGNYTWDQPADVVTSFGGAGQTPLVGIWTLAGFSLSTSPSSAGVMAGGTLTSQITINPTNGFNSPVTLNLTDVPQGLTASVNNTTITVATTSSTPAQTYVVAFSAAGGGITRHNGLTVTVSAGVAVSCTVSPNPVAVNTAATYTAHASGGTAPYGYSWVGSKFGSGMTTSFTPTSTGYGYSENIGITDNAGIQASNWCPPLWGVTGPDFSLSPPVPQTVAAGSTISLTLSISPLNNFVGVISLTPSWPAGIAGYLSPASINSSGSTTMQVTAASTTAAGTYTVQVTATGPGGSPSHVVFLNLTVTSTSAPSMQISSSTLLQSAPPGSTVRYALILNNTGSNSLNFAVPAGLPSGATYSFTSSPAGGNGVAELTVSTLPGTPLGTSQLTITASAPEVSLVSYAYLAVAAAASGPCAPGAVSNATIHVGVVRTANNQVRLYADSVPDLVSLYRAYYLARVTARPQFNLIYPAAEKTDARATWSDTALVEWYYTLSETGVGTYSIPQSTHWWNSPYCEAYYGTTPVVYHLAHAETIQRPTRPDYSPAGGPVMFMGFGVSYDGPYTPSTSLIPGNTNGAVGTPQWRIKYGSDFGTLSCTSCTNTAFTATKRGTGCLEYDVVIIADYGGLESDPFYLFINAPDSTQADTTYSGYWNYTFLLGDGYESDIHYKVFSMCLLNGEMNSYSVNELFVGEWTNDFAGANWLHGPQGGFPLSYGDSVWKDSITFTSEGCASQPCIPLLFEGPHLAVHHVNQQWFVGSVVPGHGVRVQSNTLRRYTDRAEHEDIFTPAH